MECPNSCGEIIVQAEVGGSISIHASIGLYFFQVVFILKFKLKTDLKNVEQKGTELNGNMTTSYIGYQLAWM